MSQADYPHGYSMMHYCQLVRPPRTLPKLGDWEKFEFRFRAVRSDKRGEPDEPLHTREVRVVVKMTGTVIHGPAWRAIPSEAQHRQFAYAQEQLQQRGLPQGPELELSVGEFGEEKFDGGPIYQEANIHLEQPFEVAGRDRIGF